MKITYSQFFFAFLQTAYHFIYGIFTRILSLPLTNIANNMKALAVFFLIVPALSLNTKERLSSVTLVSTIPQLFCRLEVAMTLPRD